MHADTLLLRQVHPRFCLDAVISSQAPFPFPKDGNLLSVYDGDLMKLAAAFAHYTQMLGYGSAGDRALSAAKTERTGLAARPDPLPVFPAHALIDCGDVNKAECRKLAKKLALLAQQRGRLHP